MIARILTSTPKPGSVELAAKQWPEHMRPLKGKNGLITGYLFFDRTANKFLSITIWESKEAQMKNSASPEQAKLRAEFRQHITDAPTVSVYEVAASLD